ncbi:LysR family transcriptional regulator [Rhodococcus rhodnii]|uniref:LysR family transcriptional regulator n=2 Tax=Rhodococcus rhodnii TaxID=38312 RepID=R7WHD1_9NOCA|nr:LysR family transcriptional regulator [Rhodococcus rhodnii]EOM74523.1 LysR family transcriptional regulator [Rhodococcus rhodnii LMG 5362]TXG89205.1 LysR family transcriptional regulator [Rhodococcus rhodnii]
MRSFDDDPIAELRGVDLNLLVVFAVLFEEGSVTRTAARLHMSQAAVSASLARLRKLFGDQLFVRAPGGVAPTAKAKNLESVVRSGLDRVHAAVVGERTFDPARDAAVFRLAMSDDLEALLLPPLIGHLTRTSPRSSAFCIH